jgi:hypothetical protein
VKKPIFFILLVLIPFVAMAEIADIPFVPEEFDVDILQYPHMILIDNPKSEQLDSYYTFTNTESSYQIRYSFFKQTNKDDPNIKMSYAFMLMPVIFNVAGYEETGASNFNDNDVKNEFNGDFGATVFIQNPESDFGEGYKYIMLNFYYKNNQGIVVQSILFNDLNFIQNEYFLEIFHSFRFHE